MTFELPCLFLIEQEIQTRIRVFSSGPHNVSPSAIVAITLRLVAHPLMNGELMTPTDVLSERCLSARELEALRGPAVRQIRREGESVVISLRGEIDLYNVDTIREALEVYRLDRQELIVLDLSRVEAIDPTALRVLLAAQRRLGWQELVAVAPRQVVRRVLEASGLDRVVPVHDSWESVGLAGIGVQRREIE